ncbi:MAG: methanogenesis marker 3 protein [Methanomicrobiales archaeon]|nr:methanogenesis marker 3 protein [Methanomicrobiales archaeon]MDI6876879.1 methanogenesis marker 3 protein [Methanomicrobiales archaeon]
MEIHLDGKRVEVDAGATLQDILPGRDPRCAVAVIVPRAAEAEQTRSLQVATSGGEVVVELLDPAQASPIISAIGGPLPIQWADRYAAAFGPFPSGIRPDRAPHLYERGDVILGCSGYDPARSALVFSRMRHVADHGAAADGGVIGRVVSGRGVIDRWSPGAALERMERIVSVADTSRSFTTTDGSLLLEEGMQVISYVAAAAEGYEPGRIDTHSAASVEHLLWSVQDGHFRVGRATSTHIMDPTPAGIGVPAEHPSARREGTITARAGGRSQGALYIYRTDLPGTPAHTVVGQVTHGIELAKLATEGDILCLQVSPERCDMIGLTVQEARRIGAARNIAVDVDAPSGDWVVVDQDPPTTLEVLAAGRVRLKSVSAGKVVDVALDDRHAPLTVKVFRSVTGLDRRRVGTMPLFFHFEDVYLFKPRLGEGMKIIPENTPVGRVERAVLAMTNDSRRGAGMVGVRTEASTEFGPTSEPFDGTNIIGTVIDMDKLKGVREKETVYIREVRE